MVLPRPADSGEKWNNNSLLDFRWNLNTNLGVKI